MMIWTVTDGNGDNHGPFAELWIACRYVADKGQQIAEPLTLAQIKNGDPRPVADVMADAYANRALEVLAAAARRAK